MMAESDESIVSTVSDVVVVAAGSVEQATATVVKGKEDEDPLQQVEEIDYHPDCTVCLQPCYYPVKLPCGHIFCFLCIKGVALRSRRCALCRQAITVDFFEKPTLMKVVGTTKEAVPKCNNIDGEQAQTSNESDETDSGEYIWFYEGRNGWWQYDEKTSAEVEKAFKTGKRSSTLLIAGFLYVVEFENMSQTRKNEPGRRRRIKRDKPGADSKGVAGIRGAWKRPADAETESTGPSLSKNEDGEQQEGVGSETARLEHRAGTSNAPRPETQQSGQTDVEQVASRLETASL